MLVVSGCVTQTFKPVSFDEVSQNYANKFPDNKFKIKDNFYDLNNNVIYGIEVMNYEIWGGKGNIIRGEATNVITGEAVLVGNYKVNNAIQLTEFPDWLLNQCRRVTGSSCYLSKIADRTLYKNYQEYYTKVIAPEQELALRHLRKKEQQELLTFNKLQTKCEELGYEGDNNIRLCIEREAEFERQIAMQKQALAAQNNNVKEEEEMGFLAQILRDVIIAYPEAKRRADAEQSRVNSAYRRGRASCSGMNKC